MAASFPSSVKTYTAKVDGIDYVKAADVNSLQDEVNAIETTLNSNFVDTSGNPRIGYVQLAFGNYTSAPGAITVAGTSYIKFVVEIQVGVGTAGITTLTTNGATGNSKSAYITYGTSTPTTTTTGGTTLPISNGATVAAGDSIVSEVYPTPNRIVSWANGVGFGQGVLNTGASALTSITIASASYPTGATYYIWGVK